MTRERNELPNGQGWPSTGRPRSDTDSLVSIVLPTYNGERFLRLAIDSVIAQTYEQWELIVVNDASNDATSSIIAEYAGGEPRIRTVSNVLNMGLPASLNAGFRMAYGTYFSWTSDDNCFRGGALAEMVGVLELHPETDLVYSDFTSIDEGGHPTRKHVAPEPEQLLYGETLGACFLYRREVHEQLGGFDEEAVLAEDYDFWLRAYEQFELTALHVDLYDYRRHGGSLSSKRRASICKASERALHNSLARRDGVSPPQRARSYLQLARFARGAGDRVAARSHLARAFSLDPRVFANARAMSLLLYAFSGK